MCLFSQSCPQDRGSGLDAWCSLVTIASVFDAFFLYISAWILPRATYRKSWGVTLWEIEKIHVVMGVTVSAMTLHPGPGVIAEYGSVFHTLRVF
jgi:hypothetical protein